MVGVYNIVFGNIGGYVGNDVFKFVNVGFLVIEFVGMLMLIEVFEFRIIGLFMVCLFFVMWCCKKFI